MKNRSLRIAAAFLAASVMVTGNPAAVYALEADSVVSSAAEDTIVTVNDDDTVDGDRVTDTVDSNGTSDTLEGIQETEPLVYVESNENTDTEMNPDADILTGATVSADSIEDMAQYHVEEGKGWDGKIPEELLNYRDIDFEVEESNIGYDVPGTDTGTTGIFSVRPVREAAIPSSYKTANSLVPAVRDQNPFGTCWSFSSMASCEISLAKKFGVDPSTLDLAERALCYFFYELEGIDDPLGNTLKDYQTAKLTKNPDIYALGGNVPLASFFLANWGVPADETKAPYSGLVSIGKGGNLTTDTVKGDDALDPSICYDSDYHVQNIRFIPEDDKTGIKKAIMDNGAVSASYYHTDSFINSTTNAYHSSQPDNSKQNHAINIIGWDDDYPKENFTIKPEENGAWLIRNSWGTDFADGGYLWMTYEEKSIDDIAVLSCEPGDNYDNNYFYDGSANLQHTSGKTGGQWLAANVFKANEDELLQAVSIAMYSTDVPYSLQVYRNLSDPSDPSSGTPMLKEPVTGTTTYSGIYTIPLGTSIPLAKDDTFAVVFTLGTESSGKIHAYTEHSHEYSWLSVKSEIKQGQSFFRNSATSPWYDMYGSSACFRIHAYTDKDEQKDHLKYYFVECEDGVDKSKTTVNDISTAVSVCKDSKDRFYIEDDTPGQDVSVISSVPDILGVGSPQIINGKRRIELIPKNRGQVTLTVNLGSNTTISNNFPVSVYELSVSFSKPSAEINTSMDDKYDVIDVYNESLKKIENVTIEGVDGFTTAYSGGAVDTPGSLRITYTGAPAAKTVNAILKIKFEGEDTPVSKPIKIVLKKVKPTVTVTTDSKVDLLYIPEEGKGRITVKVNNGKINNVTFVDSGKNGKTGGVLNTLAYEAGAPVIASDGLTASVEIKAKAGANTKYSKGCLKIYLDGFTEPISKEISVSYRTSQLKAVNTSASLLTSNDIVLDGSRIDIQVKNQTANRMETFDSPTITVTDKNNVSLSSRYTPSYSDGVISLKPAPGMNLTSKGEELYIKVSDSSHSVPFTINKFKVNAVKTGSMSLALAKASHTMYFYEGDNALNKGISASTNLSIRNCAGLTEYIKNGLVIEGADVKSKDAVTNGKLSVVYDQSTGIVTASYPEGNAPAPGTYKYRFVLPKSHTGANKDLSALLTVNVKKLDKEKAKTCKVTATGKYDVLDRSGTVTYKPTFSNLPAQYTVSDVELAGDDAGKFSLVSFTSAGVTAVSLKPGAVYSTAQKYNLILKYTISVGDGTILSTAPINKISVSQSKATIKAYGADTFGMIASEQKEAINIKAYNSKGKSVAVSSVSLLNPNTSFSLFDHGDGTYSIKYDPNGTVKKGSSYSLKFCVTLKDKAENTAAITYTYKVSVAK